MKPLTLFELNSIVRAALQNSLTSPFWLKTEISEVRESYGGHCFVEFIQKDLQNRNLIAKARGTIWNDVYALLKPMFEQETGRPFAAGIKVLVEVSVNFHELHGYSLNVCDIDPSYTLGDMARLRHDIINRLESDGILNDNKSLKFPLLANRVAIISSLTAAGYEDFINQLHGNNYGLSFTAKLFPAIMQGTEVEQSVLLALENIMASVDKWDVVAIIRGGGSVSDLSGFDSYMLAVACAQFPLPIITGIGHERDDTLIDMIAHTRVKTPTAAATFLINHQVETARKLHEIVYRLKETVSEKLNEENRRINSLTAVLSSVFFRWFEQQRNYITQTLLLIHYSAELFIEKKRWNLKQVLIRLSPVSSLRLEQEHSRLKVLVNRVKWFDPLKLLKRGFSLTTCNGCIVRSVTEVRHGDELITRMYDGELHSKVE